MGGVHVSNLHYINVSVFYKVEILDTISLGFRGTNNNKIYIAIANELSIVALFKLFTMYISLTTTLNLYLFPYLN